MSFSVSVPLNPSKAINKIVARNVQTTKLARFSIAVRLLAARNSGVTTPIDVDPMTKPASTPTAP